MSPLRLLQLPLEIRELIYHQCLHPESARWKDSDSYPHYSFDLSLLRVCRQMHDEALAVFHQANHFVAIESPWPQAAQHTATDGFVPVLMSGDRARRFNEWTALVKIDAPDFNPFDEQPDRFVIHANDLAMFCEMWDYQDMSMAGLNQHLRLILQLREVPAGPGETEARPLAFALQRKLIIPFGVVRELKCTEVRGLHEKSLDQELREAQAKPHKPAEECLDDAVRLKDLGNKALTKEDSRAALQYYFDSFRELHIVCDGKRRSVWADHFFQRDMQFGNHKGQAGSLARLILRIKLVANIVFAYLKLDNEEGFTWAHFWGMRTIKLMRETVDDEAEEPLLDFPAANELGKIYYRTGVASKQLGNKDEARNLLKVALAYLPNDPQVKQEFATIALKLG